MYAIDKTQFGLFVAQLRKEKGLTQKELAAQLYVSDKAVSKWEVGASIPDTALLVPLAEILGVTVTELLQCKRSPADQMMSAADVEDVVQAAVHYGKKEKLVRAWTEHTPLQIVWLVCSVLGAVLLFFCWHQEFGAEGTLVILAAGFGGYFAFAAPLRLPSIYDEQRISMYYDSGVRMNVPGVYFNNQNWPHIRRTLIVWSCAAMVGTPAAALVMRWLAVGQLAQGIVLLLAVLGGMFAPLYWVGRKEG